MKENPAAAGKTPLSGEQQEQGEKNPWEDAMMDQLMREIGMPRDAAEQVLYAAVDYPAAIQGDA